MTWYRSLYWRIAVGFIACLALLLIVQGVLFVWMMAQAGATIPNQPPNRLAQAIAIDLSQALERDASLDVEPYLREEYGRDVQPFFVLIGERAIVVGGQISEARVREARIRFDAFRALEARRLNRGVPLGRGAPFRYGPRAFPPQAPEADPDDPGMPGSRAQRFPPRDGMGEPDPGVDALPGPGALERRGLRGPVGSGGGFRAGWPAAVIVGGRLQGLVVVPPQPPFTFLLTRYAPTLLTVAAATLVVGAVLAAVVVFGPTRRRLKAVEEAARRIGSGDLTARAPETGNDEVAAVASAFNAMAEDLTARTQALVAADALRRQLLADVSHELNTPVTAMRGYLETLSMPELSIDPETRARYLAIVSDETARLERTIGDLLDLARLEGGGGSLLLEPIQVDELFARVRARHERTAAGSNVSLRTTITPGAERIVADRTRLEQALQNLAANALRYAPAGSAVTLDAVRVGATVALSVTDQGAGIAAEHLAHVFERFYKAEPSRTVQAEGSGGSGLGLSIVKAIVERHGGRIFVASQPGRTTFTIAGLAAAPAA
ncbi:MAG: sensor histidine kinase [Vicinamibacterales bacterium]